MRKFEKTAQPIPAVKVSVANSVQRDYKVTDGAHLVGE
jgi:hypothetical protein